MDAGTGKHKQGNNSNWGTRQIDRVKQGLINRETWRGEPKGKYNVQGARLR